MAQEEMAAEKARALLVRARARDAYDLWFLAGRGIRANAGLIDRKLKMYKLERTPAAVASALRRCRQNWKRELRPMAPGAPDFDAVERAVRDALLPGGASR